MTLGVLVGEGLRLEEGVCDGVCVTLSDVVGLTEGVIVGV